MVFQIKSIEPDLTGVTFQETADHADGGGLAGAVGTQETEDLSSMYIQGQITYGYEIPVRSSESL